MGCTGSTLTPEQKEEREREKKLNKELNEQKQYDEALIKLLLLGAGESGKSTIFKQMRILYGEGFGTKTVLENCDKCGHPLTDQAAIDAAKAIDEVADDTVLTADIAASIKTLWENDQFQATYQDRSSYQLFDCYCDFAKSVSNKYPEWGGDNWIPSVSDVMKARVRTSGIVEEKYVIDGVNFRMYDVGGQRNERKKWIHCFDGVTAIIFVGAISEFDQVLYEDKSQNRLVEAIELFDEICNSKWFTETSIILFLNKRDLFEEKFVQKRVPLNVTGLPMFDTWNKIDWETTTPEEAVATAHSWIVAQFMERNKKGKEIYHHITCATDTKNVETVFNACKDIILKSNLRGSGFME